MSFDFCYLDNESKFNIKKSTRSIRFQGHADDAAKSEHGGDFTIGRVPTATVFDPQPWVLASLVCPLSRFTRRAPARQRGAAATCSRCLRNTCGRKRVPHSRCCAVGLLTESSMQVMMLVDFEVSLRLRPCDLADDQRAYDQI